MGRVMLGLGVSALLAGLMVGAPAPASAQSRCPAGSTGCTMDNVGPRVQQRVDEGKYRVQSTPNPAKKAYEAGKTAVDCVKCGFDAVRDGASKITPGASQ